MDRHNGTFRPALADAPGVRCCSFDPTDRRTQRNSRQRPSHVWQDPRGLLSEGAPYKGSPAYCPNSFPADVLKHTEYARASLRRHFRAETSCVTLDVKIQTYPSTPQGTYEIFTHPGEFTNWRLRASAAIDLRDPHYGITVYAITEKPPHNQVTILSPTIGIALAKLVMTVAPQKLICNGCLGAKISDSSRRPIHECLHTFRGPVRGMKAFPIQRVPCLNDLLVLEKDCGAVRGTGRELHLWRYGGPRRLANSNLRHVSTVGRKSLLATQCLKVQGQNQSVYRSETLRLVDHVNRSRLRAGALQGANRRVLHRGPR